jgi:hypothetical protein
MIPFTTTTTMRIEVTFNNIPSNMPDYQLKIAPSDDAGKAIFDGMVKPSKVIRSENKVIFYVDHLHPRLWYPADPRLYEVTLRVNFHGGRPQVEKVRTGFRSFQAKKGHLYLNGRPIFLRGIAINPPGRGIPAHIEQSRAFAEHYVSYMKSIHVNIIRIPDNETWYDVCDELGMMVFGGNYSGSVNGKKPPHDYDKAISWYEDEKFAPFAHHPSLVIYAMTNETPFAGPLMPKWKKFLGYAHQQLLKWDSTRVYIGDAGYGYGQSGDICDLHRYWGWYYSSPFTFLHVRHNSDIIPFSKTKDQPVTFTECVGNYTGPGGQYNLTPDHKNPGSQLNWTGHAPWDLQAQLADEHQCFTFREATELFRQLRSINHDLSGVFPFTIMFHNWNTIHHFVDMDPKAVASQAAISYQPVLLSWECWTPDVYAGSVIHPVMHVIDDDDRFRDLRKAIAVYQIQDKTGAIMTTDTLRLPLIKYYGTWEKQLSLKLPALVAVGPYKLIGKILVADSLVSRNYADLFIADPEYVGSGPLPERRICLYDPAGNTAAAFRKLSIRFRQVTGFNDLNDSLDLLVVGENALNAQVCNDSALIRGFMEGGGRVLCLQQRGARLGKANAFLPNPVNSISMNIDTPVYPPPPRPSYNGYNVNPERPGNTVFAGISRLNLHYWSDYTGWNEHKSGFPAIYPVTSGFTLADKDDIATTAVLADYGPALDGIALAEMFAGRGSILLCGLDIVPRAGLDPVAGRILKNMVGYMASKKQHYAHPLITRPIVWGDYGSERGLITGINSGLLLNGKPRLVGNERKIPLKISKEGYEFAGHRGGFNSRPGIQYVPFGRRPFGPYHLRGFGDIPEPDDKKSNIGEGMFWCRIPAGKTLASTLVWNPSTQPLVLRIGVNDNRPLSQTIMPGKTVAVKSPLQGTRIKMTFTGDRRLVLLQTSFLAGQ